MKLSFSYKNPYIFYLKRGPYQISPLLSHPSLKQLFHPNLRPLPLGHGPWYRARLFAVREGNIRNSGVTSGPDWWSLAHKTRRVIRLRVIREMGNWCRVCGGNLWSQSLGSLILASVVGEATNFEIPWYWWKKTSWNWVVRKGEFSDMRRERGWGLRSRISC